MVGYVRVDTTNKIANGEVVDASFLDAEFDGVQAAFHAATGHVHDGTAANGAPITKVGPTQDVTVSGTAVLPKTDNTLDLGSATFEFKDLWIDGTANIDSLVVDTADINAGTIDGTVIGATTPAAATVTTLAATSGTVGGSAITTANSTQTLLNKTLQNPVIDDPTVTGISTFASTTTFNGVVNSNANLVATTITCNSNLVVNAGCSFNGSTGQIQTTRASLGAPQNPQVAGGVGQWLRQTAAATTTFTLPASGTWAYFYILTNASTNVFISMEASVAAGGTAVLVVPAGQTLNALSWRIS